MGKFHQSTRGESHSAVALPPLAPPHMAVRIAPDAVAVVIDAGRLSTRIGLAGSETFTHGPALPEASMETALRELLEEGVIDLSGCPVCVTESMEQRLGPKAGRERWVSLLFDCFSVHSVYLLLQPTSALYTAGLTTGLVVDATHVVPIYEGYALPHAVKKLDDTVSLAKTAYNSVFTCDCDIWKDLLTHVVVCGRDGEVSEKAAATVQAELTAAVEESHPGLFGVSSHRVCVRTAGHGEADSWHGASLFASFEAGTGLWIRRDDYDATGAAIVHQNCT